MVPGGEVRHHHESTLSDGVRREIRMSNGASFSRSPWTGNADAAERKHWIGVAAGAAATLAPAALLRDRDNVLPQEELDLLRESGLVNLVVPTEFGASGAHWEAAFGVIREIARGCLARHPSRLPLSQPGLHHLLWNGRGGPWQSNTAAARMPAGCGATPSTRSVQT